MAYDLNGLYERVQRSFGPAPNMSLNELSARLGVERHTVEKAVKQATGKTFREMRNDVLLQQAKSLLDGNPNQSIKEVAFKLGYRSQRSFSRFIKSSLGCSPKELRADLHFRPRSVGASARGKAVGSSSV